MDALKKQSPKRQRALPKYHRSAYKIFFHEKRAEIIDSLLREYDNSFEQPHRDVHVKSIISLPQLTFDINQMWKNMSPQDRDKFRDRALLESKRKRVGSIDPFSCMRVSSSDQSKQTLPFPATIDESWNNDGIFDAFDVIDNDIYDTMTDDLDDNTSVDLSTMHEMLQYTPLCDVHKDHGLRNDIDPVKNYRPADKAGKAALNISTVNDQLNTHPSANDADAPPQKLSDPLKLLSTSSKNTDSIVSAIPPYTAHPTSYGETKWMLVNSYSSPTSFVVGGNPAASSIMVAGVPPVPPSSPPPTTSHITCVPMKLTKKIQTRDSMVGENLSMTSDGSSCFVSPCSSIMGHGAPIVMCGYPISYLPPHGPPYGHNIISYNPPYHFAPPPPPGTTATTIPIASTNFVNSLIHHSLKQSQSAVVTDPCQKHENYKSMV